MNFFLNKEHMRSFRDNSIIIGGNKANTKNSYYISVIMKLNNIAIVMTGITYHLK